MMAARLYIYFPYGEISNKFLKLGIQKYGNSWSKILIDPEFKFDPSRKNATLCRKGTDMQILLIFVQ